jgi:hypothetical protein
VVGPEEGAKDGEQEGIHVGLKDGFAEVGVAVVGGGVYPETVGLDVLIEKRGRRKEEGGSVEDSRATDAILEANLA